MGWGLKLDPGYQRLALDLGPSLYWALNAENGATDLSGNGRDGIGAGGISIGSTAAGPFPGTSCTNFDGTDDRISTASYVPYVNAAARTFVGWATRDTSSSTDTLIATTSTTTAPVLRLETGSQNVFFDAQGGGGDVGETFAAAWPGNTQWVHWVLGFDEPGDLAVLFINGLLAGGATHTDAYAPVGTFQLGQFGGSGNPFDGKMAHFAIYERSLTLDEITRLYMLGPVAPLDINDGTRYRALEPLSLSPPPRDPQYASSVSTEGDRLLGSRDQNRTFTWGMRVYGTSAADLQDNLAAFTQKVAKINREGGELEVTTQAGTVVTFDLLGADFDTPVDSSFGVNHRAEVEIQFEARPYGRGTPVQSDDQSTTTLPALVFIEDAIPGDVPALGRLVIDEDDADDQWFLAWGLESRHYDKANAANKALFYQAEDLTPLSTSTDTAGAAGASGTNVIRNTDLTTSYQAVLSTEIDATNTHLGHVGTYRVWARLYRPAGNTGAVDVALEWAEGDFRKFTRNEAVSFEAEEREGVFTLADLGLVHLTKVAQGLQRWEGRIVARSTVAGDELDVDCLFIFPVEEGYGEVRALPGQPTLTGFSARDEFNQTTGALTGKVLPVGGTWTVVASSDADDFTVSGIGPPASRIALSDASLTAGRYVSAGTTNYIGVAVRATVGQVSTAAIDALHQGVFARLVDINNWFLAVLGQATGGLGRILRVYKRVAGSATLVWARSLSDLGLTDKATIQLAVLSNGNWTVTVTREGANITTLSGNDSVLATGGTLATGKVGLYDAYTSASANTRTYEDFVAYAIQADAAIFASQSLEIRHDRVIREDSTGALWTPVSDYQGDYLLIPPAGKEERETRIILKASRNLPESGDDPGIDDISARLTYVPRFLQLPS